MLSDLLCLSLSHPPASPSSLIFTLPPAHTHIRTHWWHKKTTFWWINLYILEPIPVSASILLRPCLLLSWVPPQPSGVISLLAMLNSLIICVLHKKRTIPQWHSTACSAWSGLALMCIGCCVVSALYASSGTLFPFLCGGEIRCQSSSCCSKDVTFSV